MLSHSFQRVCIALLIIAMFLFSIHTLTDINQDIGMHLSLGKIIWQTHHVPTTNLFSYTNPGYPSVNNRWIFEVLLYLGVSLVGLKGMIAAKAGIIALAFGFAFFTSYRYRDGFGPILIGIVSMFILVDRTFLRPEIFSFLFLSIYFYILFRKPRYPWLWLLIAIQLLWINFHIYFFIGPLIWILYAAPKWIRERSIPRNDILLTICLGLINLLNPTGLTAVLFPFRVLSQYGIPVLENLSLFDLGPYQYPHLPIYAFYLGLVVILSSFVVNRTRWKENIFGALLAITTAILSFSMLRNMPLFALALMPVAMKNFSESGMVLSRKIFSILGAFLLLLLIAGIVTGSIFRWAGIRREFGLQIPDFGFKAVAFVKQNHIAGPVFNNMNAGSFLVWQLPDQKVFFDARPEDYPPAFEKQIYIPMQSDPAMWKRYSDSYHINYVFYAWQETYYTHWANTFLKDMTKNSDWPIVYVDNSIAIFVKNTPENRAVIERTKAWRSKIRFQ